MGTTYTRKQPVHHDALDRDDLYETRTPSSARRYRPQDTLDDLSIPSQGNITLVQRRRSLNTNTTTGTRQSTGVNAAVIPAKNVSRTVSRTVDYRLQQAKGNHGQRSNKRFFITALLVGMIATVMLLVGLSMVSGWWQDFQNDLRYGNPRTAHSDIVVGHNDSSSNPTHFIFINLKGHIQVIELPGDDPARTRIFTGPVFYGPGQDKLPVTGEPVKDPRTGMINLIVHVGSQEFLLINDGTTFHPR